MKKIIACLLTLILTFATITLVGCEKKGGTSNSASAEKYTVSFFIEGELYSQTQVEKNKKAIPPIYRISSTLTGEITVGSWYSDEALTQEFDIDNTPITKDITLYAKLTQENPFLTVEELLTKVEQNATNAQTYVKVTALSGKVNNGEAIKGADYGFDISDGKITINGKEIRVNYDKTYFSEFFSDSEKEFSKKTIVFNTSGNFITIDVDYTKNNRLYREFYVLNSDNYVMKIAIVDKTDSISIIDYNLVGIEYEKNSDN